MAGIDLKIYKTKVSIDLWLVECSIYKIVTYFRIERGGLVDVSISHVLYRLYVSPETNTQHYMYVASGEYMYTFTTLPQLTAYYGY